MRFSILSLLSYLPGCEDLAHLSAGGNCTYTSRTTAQSFLEAFSDVIEEELLQQLKGSSYLSLLIDESTDLTITKKLIMYVRFISKGRVLTRFLCNLELNNGTAAAIKEAIDAYFLKIGVPPSKLVGFGSDGASVMLGSKNGVATKLREHNPFMVNVHCVAHRFALCTSQGANKVSLIKGFVETLTSLYYFFQHSAVRCSKLQTVQEALEEPILSVKEVHSVRWLAFFKALNNVFCCWASITTTLGDEASDEGKGNAKAKGLYKAFTKFEFIATMHFLMDAVPVMQNVSKAFQKVDVDFSVVMPIVTSTVEALAAMKETNGPHLNKYISSIHGQEGDSLHFQGIDISCSSQQRVTFQRARVNFIDEIIENVQNRFPVSQGGVISAFSVLNFKESLAYSSSKWEGMLEVLLDHYGQDKGVCPALIDANKCKLELQVLVPLVRDNYSGLPFQELWGGNF